MKDFLRLMCEFVQGLFFLFLLSGFSDIELKFQSFLIKMDVELLLAYATTSYIIAVKKKLVLCNVHNRQHNKLESAYG